MNKTMAEVNIEMYEQLRLAEVKYWQKIHPDAKVRLNKKNDEIVITYRLPGDIALIQKFIKAL